VPDFYADVTEVTEEELKIFDETKLNIDAYKAGLGEDRQHYQSWILAIPSKPATY